MELNDCSEEFFKSNSNKDNFLGYGEKQSLTEIEVNEAIKRVDSCHGINFAVSAPGKLILFGEHGDTYDRSAIAASVNKRTYLRLTENKIHDVFAICMRDIDFSYHTSFDKIVCFINEGIPNHDFKILTKPIDNPDINHKRFLEMLKEDIEKYIHPFEANREQTISFCLFLYLLRGIFYRENSDATDRSQLLSPFVIDVSSELTIGAGVGSSASFCVCVVTALLYYKNIKIHGLNAAKEITFSEKGLELISKWAFNAEKIIHGQLSGIDSAVTTYGSFIEVKTLDSKRKFIDVPDPPKLHVILIYTGIKRNTIDLVNNVAMRHYCNPEPIELILNAIHQVSEKASRLIKNIGHSQCNGLGSPEIQILEELVDINQGLLYSLGVSHKCLQEICSICSESGLSSKLTGAGGGGCAFVIVPPDFDKDVLLNCVNKLKDKNFEVCDIELGDEGVRLEDLTRLKR